MDGNGSSLCRFHGILTNFYLTEKYGDMARTMIMALALAAALAAACGSGTPPRTAAQPRLEDILESDLRTGVIGRYASSPDVDSVEWRVTGRAARPGHVDFDYRAYLTVFRGGRQDVYRVSVESTGGRYPEDYYDIRVRPVEM